MMTIKISTSFKKKGVAKAIRQIWQKATISALSGLWSPLSPRQLVFPPALAALNGSIPRSRPVQRIKGPFWGRRDPLCVQLLSTSAMVFRAVLDGIPQFMTPSSST